MDQAIVIRPGSLDEALTVHGRVPELRPPGTIADYTRKFDGRAEITLVV